MQVLRISPKSLMKIENLTLCLGYFDALHLGHISLINKAKEIGGTIALLTMDPNPSSFFNADVKEVNTLIDKIEILKDMNIDYFIILDTTLNVLNLSGEDFINSVLLPLGVKNVVCGFDYHFGNKRSGNIELLRKHKEFKTHVCEEVTDNGEKISTTLVKKLLNEGNVRRLNKLLTREYQIKGKVVKGNSLGHTIGFPTANVVLEDDRVYPKNGVYSGYLLYKGKRYLSMINIGTHPTVNKLNKEIVEAHLIDENIDLYDKDVTIIFKDYIRDECKFSTLEELVSQLNKDKNKIKGLK